MKPRRSSTAKYLILVVLILAIFGITIGLFVNFSKIPLLRSVNKIVQVQKDFTKLDSCIFKLYNAENSFRMYVVNGEKIYYDLFTSEIKEVSSLMDTIEKDNQNEGLLSSESFDSLIKQKRERTTQFINLKRLSDSLINFSAGAEKQVNELKPNNNKLFTARQFKSIIKIDTIKPGTVAKPKKKFFGRLKAAIFDKGTNGTDSSKSTIVKTVVSDDTSSVSVAYNNLQLKAINDYYLRLYSTNKKLKDKERDLLDLNHLLITNIVDGLKRYKLKERNYYSSVQQIINTSAFDTVENLDNFTTILLAFAIGLLLFVFYMIYNFYRNEKALIDYSNKASLYALSKSRFLANMSHEIRTPLNSIVGFSEQLSQVNLEPQQKEQVGAIRNSSVMLLDVVNDILDFSKYETGKVTLENVPFSPKIAIQDVFDSMKIQATKKKIGFVMNMPVEENVYILGDPLRLKQVVMNLLSNGIKFTNEGSVTLTSSLIKNSDHSALLKVSIEDTGLGINPVDQRIIFDEFAQVYYSSTKEKQQGTGLGLAICKKIIELQGGSIEVNSEEGKGSTFSFELPYQITEKPEKPELTDTQTGLEVELLAGKRVLLADDNMLNILLASTILKKYHVVFDAAYNGKEALELFNENIYDIILTDIQMPEMGGIELTNKIRSCGDPAKEVIPILGVTANVMQEDRKKYIASGMNDLVLKPFLEQELLAKMIQFLK
ncbi:ATP-binding protein [Pedobacter punctiformis]|uniref:histidine kinase n=1 Tax=Pedobacter punctiformis TaxID=3004097 RepID=A0ABT4L3T0_9SPHI|nr:ATP-binding protein [Pedobacter sp. HCMS5-2]MCZ4242486.1 ATP-binding protein [Pedobacter sp. HCMS5-2]